MRSDTYEAFLREAFGCKPCRVVLQPISKEEIANMIHGKCSQKRKSTSFEEKLAKRRRDDAIFKPPVPYPVQEFEIQSINHSGKYLILNSAEFANRLPFFFSNFTVHQHLIRIWNEHDYC